MANKRRRRRRSGHGRRRKWSLFTNRRNPNSNWLDPFDVWYNLKERVYGWWYRIPRGATIRWKDGKIDGYYTKNRWPN